MGLTHLSLFSGVGGLDIAAHWAGIKSIGLCEWADYPHKLLKKRFQGVPIWRDIRDLTGSDFYDKTGLRTVTVLSGGFPCQPFSHAGQRRGAADDRYIWPEMLRVISELRPAWIIGENVLGITSMAESAAPPRVESRTINRWQGEDHYQGVLSQSERMLLHGILEDLHKLGYAVQAFVVPACGVDAPHKRERIAIVGYSKHNGQLAKQGL